MKQRLSVAPNDRFGRWTVVEEQKPRWRPGTKAPLRVCLCQCDCGGRHVVNLHSLFSGVSTQCKPCGIAAAREGRKPGNAKGGRNSHATRRAGAA